MIVFRAINVNEIAIIKLKLNFDCLAIFRRLDERAD